MRRKANKTKQNKTKKKKKMGIADLVVMFPCFLRLF